MGLMQEKARITAPGLRHCAVVAATAHAADAVARFLAARGVDCLRTDLLAPPPGVTPEVVQVLKDADFVCGVAGNGGPAEAVFFLLGMAHSRGKPALLVTDSAGQTLDFLPGLHVVRSSAGRLDEVAAEIERFLRHAKPLPRQSQPVADVRPLDLSWARERVAVLERAAGKDSTARSEFELARLIADLFRVVGLEASQNDFNGLGSRTDILVWPGITDVQTPAPIIVECKFSGREGARQSALCLDAERAARFVDAVGAFAAVIVYAPRLPAPFAGMPSIPKVLFFSIHDLIETLEQGRFADEVLRRRRRAATTGAVTGDGR